MMKNHFDLLIIGGGSAGLAAAKMASDHGACVAIIENDRIGGTCVNVGCIPKKIMWYADVDSDFGQLVQRRENYLVHLNQLYADQLQTQKIKLIDGFATFLNSKTIKVGTNCYTANNIIIASGCSPTQPTIPGAEFAIDSNGFFALQKKPKKVAIVGAGYIAVELASILNKLGSEVSLVLRYEKVLRTFDTSLSDTSTEILLQQGIKIFPKHSIKKITRAANGSLTLHCNHNKKISRIDCVIYAIGRTPNTKLLNLAAASVKTDAAGFIATNKSDRTNIKHIYAIGDVAGKKLLTPVAVTAGRLLAKRIFGCGKKTYLDYKNIPTVVFSHPPLGSVGLSEQEAVNKYGRNKLVIYQNKFTSLEYALSKFKLASQFKLVTLKSNAKIIGCHIIGPNADEILQGFAVAIKMGATKDDFDATVGIHPTSAEELVTMKTEKS